MTSRTPRETRLHLIPDVPDVPDGPGAAEEPTAPGAPAQSAAGVRRPPAARRCAPRSPRGVAPREELARQARALLADAVRLARWAQHAGTAPDTGRAAAELGMSAGEVRDHWGRARLAGLVEQVTEIGTGRINTADAVGAVGATGTPGGPVRAGWRLRAWERDDTAVLRGWVALFDGWSLARSAPAAADPGAVAEVVEAVPQLLSVMRLSDGPVTTAGLLDLLRQRITELRADQLDVAPEPGDAPGPAAPEAGQARLLGWALDALAAVGALTLHRQDGRVVGARLTQLGGWAMWTKLEHICIAAQSPAGNIEQSAVDMLRGCATLTPGPARAEYRAWLAARPTGSAVAELLGAARGEDALVRGLAFEALRVVGAPAQSAVRAVAGEPELRPYALLWLAEHDEADPWDPTDSPLGVLTREEATWLWVDTASAAHDHGAERLLIEHLDTAVQPSVAELVDEVRACGHPHTVQVLLALAASHPDPAIAKRVRRAAFQVHTGA